MNYSLSVIMAVYNGEKFLKEAIESVLCQSFRDFEFIIINDGSTDKSLNIIMSYDDERIKVINNSENMGLIYSLNYGLDLSKGKYVVRFDADDICMKDRFKIQYDFMEKNKDIVMSSTLSYMFINKNKLLKRVVPGKKIYNELKAQFIFENHINHASVIMRKGIIDKEKYRYDKRFLHIEDYALWLEISKKYKIETLNKVLMMLRISTKSVTSTANRDMMERKKIYDVIYKEIYELLEYKPTSRDYDIHFEIAMIQNLKEFKYSIIEKDEYCFNLIKHNCNKYITNEYLQKEIINQLYKNAVYTTSLNEFKKTKAYKILQISLLKWISDKILFKFKSMIKRIVR